MTYEFYGDSVPRYDECEFWFQNSLIKTVKYPLTKLDMNNIEYNSPLLGKSCTDKGDYNYFSSLTEDGVSIEISKVFKPSNCDKVILYYNRVDDSFDSKCVINFTEQESKRISVINITNQTDITDSPEVLLHLKNNFYSTDEGFIYKPHQFNVNGSDFEVNWSDIFETNRQVYLTNSCSSLGYNQFMLNRDFSKYYIGSLSKYKSLEDVE